MSGSSQEQRGGHGSTNIQIYNNGQVDDFRARTERTDLYVRFYKQIRSYDERLVALVGAVQADRRGESVATLRGATVGDVQAELVEHLAAMNALLAEFYYMAPPEVTDAAETAYSERQIAYGSACEGSLAWIDDAAATGTRFLMASREGEASDASRTAQEATAAPGHRLERKPRPELQPYAGAVRFQRGRPPWLPTEDARIVATYAGSSTPTAGVLEQDGREFFFSRLSRAKHRDDFGSWIYYPARSGQRARIEAVPVPQRQQAFRAEGMTGPLCLAVTDDLGNIVDFEVVEADQPDSNLFVDACARLYVRNRPGHMTESAESDRET